jgi:thioesterase domain-containing protein
VLAKASGQEVAGDLGWRDVVGGRLQFHETQGDHFSMMKSDHATHLAELLNNVIDVAATESQRQQAIIP